MNTYAKADTLMGAALAPLDSDAFRGARDCFQFVHRGFRPICNSHWAGANHRADVCGAFDGRVARIAFGRNGGDCLPDRRRHWFAVFRGGRGRHRAFSWTNSGYLVAFPAAAFITGAFAEHGWDKRYLTAAAAMAIGSVIIFLGGWAWFAILTHTPPVTAFKLAVLPFLLGDVDQDCAGRRGAAHRLGALKRR